MYEFEIWQRQNYYRPNRQIISQCVLPKTMLGYDKHEWLSLVKNYFDHYGQTEVGMVVCNHHALEHEVRAGSAGFASPGYRVVALDEQGHELGADSPGILAVDISQSPMMWFGG